jgi:DNA-binding transcriptional LysR family regulator
VFETSNAEVIKEQVARGVGVSILTRSAAYRDVLARQLAITKLDGESPQLEIYVAVREGHELSRPANVFLDLLYKTMEAQPPESSN